MGSSGVGFQNQSLPENAKVDGIAGGAVHVQLQASSSKDDTDFHSSPKLPNAVYVCVPYYLPVYSYPRPRPRVDAFHAQ